MKKTHTKKIDCMVCCEENTSKKIDGVVYAEKTTQIDGEENTGEIDGEENTGEIDSGREMKSCKVGF